jgi:hypothetical protein
MANISVSRKSGFIQRSGQMRRKTTWIGGAYANIVLASGIPQIVTSLGAAALALRPFTIVRTRGVLLIGTDQEAADEAQRVIYGEAVVSDEASAVGFVNPPLCPPYSMVPRSRSSISNRSFQEGFFPSTHTTFTGPWILSPIIYLG